MSEFESDTTYCSQLGSSKKLKLQKSTLNSLTDISKKIEDHLNGKVLLANEEVLQYMKHISQLKTKSAKRQEKIDKIRSVLNVIYERNQTFVSMTQYSIREDIITGCGISQDLEMFTNCKGNFEPKISLDCLNNKSPTTFGTSMLTNQHFVSETQRSLFITNNLQTDKSQNPDNNELTETLTISSVNMQNSDKSLYEFDNQNTVIATSQSCNRAKDNYAINSDITMFNNNHDSPKSQEFLISYPPNSENVTIPRQFENEYVKNGNKLATVHTTSEDLFSTDPISNAVKTFESDSTFINDTTTLLSYRDISLTNKEYTKVEMPPITHVCTPVYYKNNEKVFESNVKFVPLNVTENPVNKANTKSFIDVSNTNVIHNHNDLVVIEAKRKKKEHRTETILPEDNFTKNYGDMCKLFSEFLKIGDNSQDTRIRGTAILSALRNCTAEAKFQNVTLLNSVISKNYNKKINTLLYDVGSCSKTWEESFTDIEETVEKRQKISNCFADALIQAKQEHRKVDKVRFCDILETQMAEALKPADMNEQQHLQNIIKTVLIRSEHILEEFLEKFPVENFEENTVNHNDADEEYSYLDWRNM